MGLFFFLHSGKKMRFQKLPVFSLVEPFLPQKQKFQIFVRHIEKMRIFVSLFENSKNFKND